MRANNVLTVEPGRISNADLKGGHGCPSNLQYEPIRLGTPQWDQDENSKGQLSDVMNGRIISHYRVLDEIGRGGMGVVYRAEDMRLQRIVALKFLPPELTSDEEAKQRFMREARAASGLDHPNVCSIHEIDESPDGRLFLAMAFYEGETLQKRIARGPIPTTVALDIAMQAAQGLRKAHEAGIVHRDIKPANLFVTRDGIVKILDFGLAKPSGQTALTRTGTTPGTIAYIAPERIRGAEADERSDLWALGVVLYEMVTGQHPFHGDNEAALLHAVLNENPKTAREVAPAIPAKLEALLKRALAKEPSARYGSAAELRQALAELETILTAPGPATEKAAVTRFIRRPGFAVPAVILLLVGLAGAGWAWNNATGARWAREQAIPEIAKLVNQGSYDAAFELAEQADRYTPDDPMLRTLSPQFAITFSVTTTPADADVYVRAYEATQDEWRHLGRTPLENLKLPRRPFLWRIEKDGFESTKLATTSQVDRVTNNRTMGVTLHPVGVHPQGMVFVPGGQSSMRLSGTLLGPVDLPPFFIDRLEVTNKAFKEFVDAGGYQDPIYWEKLDFSKDSQSLTWDEVRTLFVDSTGRPGPATWELGDYPGGKDDYPVTGVSWYEAMAYANYRGKALPTVYHWGKAALPESEMASSLAVSLVPLSNFGSAGPAPGGRHQGIGPYGTYDMQGNVREWSWNRGPGGGWILGGAWNDPDYFYGHALAASLLDRSATNGFRLVQEVTPESVPQELRMPVNLTTQRDVTAVKPASNEVFEVYRRLFSYSSGELNASAPSIVQTTDDWTKQRVTINTGYRNERMDVYLFIPRNARGPFQPVVFFPPFGVFQIQRSINMFDPAQPGYPLDHIIKAGRILVQPIYQGSYERWNRLDVTDEVNYPRRMVDWRWDLGRTLDYLETRDDIDAAKIGYVGTSFGASYALPLLAIERRFKAALLVSGGLTNQEIVPPITDSINYAPRITIPVLMLSGKFDNFFSVKASQEPLFNLLGTPPKDKRYAALEYGHAFPPRDKLINETVTWLDKYLGPVK